MSTALPIDRRRLNGPPGGTKPPVFATTSLQSDIASLRPTRSRAPNELRKMFLQTGIIPSASGSAYLEIPPSSPSSSTSFLPPTTSLKLLCTVHGPRPLPRSAPFSPNLLLSTYLKFAPFATRRRRGYLRDAAERDLGVHLETALRGAIIADRWPKSGLDVSVLVLEGEEDAWWGDVGDMNANGGISGGGVGGGWGLMSVLANAITVASAAIVDARVDCLGLISGGVAAVVQSQPQDDDETESARSQSQSQAQQKNLSLVLDPTPPEHSSAILAAAVVGYMPASDELTEVWLRGNIPAKKGLDHEALIDGAVEAARAVQAGVLGLAVLESAERQRGVEGVAAEGR